MKTIIKYQFSILCTLIFCFIVSLGGCYSMEPETIDAEDINKQKDYEILSLTLKDSTKIVKDQLNYIHFIKGVSDSTGKFIHSLYSRKNKSMLSTDSVPLCRVYKVELGKDKIDVVTPMIVLAGITLLIVGMMLFIYSSYKGDS